MPALLERIYAVSPVWLQQAGISAFGAVWRKRRFGGDFRKTAAEFAAREAYTAQQWNDYQTQQLRRLLQSARENVPHYTRMFASLHLGDAELSRFTLEDLARLPLLQKETLRRDPAAFLSTDNSGEKVHSYFTSGTTGTPLEIKATSAMAQTLAAAYQARCRRWAGVDHEVGAMKRAMIGGRLVVPKAQSKPPYWRYNAFEKQLYMSAFHISPATARDYVEALNEFAPDYLVGYASSHFFLARMICEMKLKVHRPRCVLTSSEKLTDEMRQTIETAYNCEVFDAYSGAEGCCLVSECEKHRLHISPDVGLLEVLDENGAAVQDGETGEIVATGLLNFTQPLIRYRTGDQAILSRRACECGRAMPVLEEICGRQEDTVILRDGRRSASFYKVLQGLRGVLEAQIVQEDFDKFVFHLVTDADFSPEQQAILLNNIRTRYGEVEVEVRLVEKIERTKNGKLRLVISKVPH